MPLNGTVWAHPTQFYPAPHNAAHRSALQSYMSQTLFQKTFPDFLRQS
jgi:hypothetical protein